MTSGHLRVHAPGFPLLLGLALCLRYRRQFRSGASSKHGRTRIADGGRVKRKQSDVLPDTDIRSAQRLITLTSAHKCWIVPRDGTNTAYLLDLRDSTLPWTRNGNAMSMVAIVKSEDQDAWRNSTGGSATQAYKIRAFGPDLRALKPTASTTYSTCCRRRAPQPLRAVDAQRSPLCFKLLFPSLPSVSSQSFRLPLAIESWPKSHFAALPMSKYQIRFLPHVPSFHGRPSSLSPGYVSFIGTPRIADDEFQLDPDEAIEVDDDPEADLIPDAPPETDGALTEATCRHLLDLTPLIFSAQSF
ncbi:hypothetical protein L226DRAFT_573628 [Lentinus tigrinus ALCF2SS1-7]|nr:hypothetical protein L226DRAFT_573628 [Lentinus tigrinus ALCF2SS1-7]